MRMMIFSCYSILLNAIFFFMPLMILAPTIVAEYNRSRDYYSDELKCISKSRNVYEEQVVNCPQGTDGAPLATCFTQICEEKSTGVMEVWKGCTDDYAQGHDRCPNAGCQDGRPEGNKFMEIVCKKCFGDYCNNKPEPDTTQLEPKQPIRCYETRTAYDYERQVEVPILKPKETTCWPGQICYSQLCQQKENRSETNEFKGCIFTPKNNPNSCGDHFGCARYGFMGAPPQYEELKCVPCDGADFCNAQQLSAYSTISVTSTITPAILEQQTSDTQNFSLPKYTGNAVMLLITFVHLTIFGHFYYGFSI